MIETYRNMLIPNAHVALARQITETLTPVGGKNMFTTGLSPDGTAPATHWISSGYIDQDYAALMPLSEWTQDENGDWQETVISAGQPEIIFGAYSQITEPDFTLADVESMLAAADVTLETPQQSWARLGLQLVTTVEEV